MKRLIAWFLLFFSLLGCCSCASGTTDVPFFSEEAFTLSGEGEVCGLTAAWELSRTADGATRLTFTAPESVAGISYLLSALPKEEEAPSVFSVSGGDYGAHGIVASLGDTEIPLSEGTLPAFVLAAAQLFSFSQGELAGVKRDASDTLAEFSCPDGDATLRFSAEGSPLAAEGTLYGVPFTLRFSEYRKETTDVQPTGD